MLNIGSFLISLFTVFGELSVHFCAIQLRDEVIVTGVTVDHIPHELSPNGTLDTAPREFAVLGLSSLDSEPVRLGTFSYDLDGAPIQEFTIEVSQPVMITCLI